MYEDIFTAELKRRIEEANRRIKGRPIVVSGSFPDEIGRMKLWQAAYEYGGSGSTGAYAIFGYTHPEDVVRAIKGAGGNARIHSALRQDVLHMGLRSGIKLFSSDPQVILGALDVELDDLVKSR